jgi:hypothetical protein
MSEWIGAHGFDPYPKDVTPGGECPVSSSGGAYECTLHPGHPGRHLAGAGIGIGIVAAWPGEHIPTAAEIAEAMGEVPA